MYFIFLSFSLFCCFLRKCIILGFYASKLGLLGYTIVVLDVFCGEKKMNIMVDCLSSIEVNLHNKGLFKLNWP